MKIDHICAILRFYGAYGDFCMKKFDVTENWLFEHLKITTSALECNNPFKYFVYIFDVVFFMGNILILVT